MDSCFFIVVQEYARDLETQLRVEGENVEPSGPRNGVELGRHFSSDELNLLGDDQVVQLYELKKETTKPVTKTP